MPRFDEHLLLKRIKIVKDILLLYVAINFWGRSSTKSWEGVEAKQMNIWYDMLNINNRYISEYNRKLLFS